MNKNGIIKFVAALAIPGFIVWGFMEAKRNADQQVNDFKKDRAEHPPSKEVDGSGFILKEVDDANQVHWILTAKKGSLDPKGQKMLLNDITVKFFKGPEVQMQLTAPAGEADESTRYVKLSEDATHKVVAEGDGGKTRMVARFLELTKNNQFLASGGVNIKLPVAKMYGDQASGNMNINDLNGFKIVGHTHAEIVVN